MSSCLAVLALVAVSGPAVAQLACDTESEPNDDEQTETRVTGPWCSEGTLPAGDQDLAVWTLTPAEATTLWTITLDGVEGTQTLFQAFSVTSEPDDPEIRVERQPLLELVVPVDSDDPAAASDVLLPAGRYLLALARSDLPGGGEPDTTDYRLRLEPGSAWPASVDIEPNDDADSAGVLHDAFTTSGDRGGNRSDLFRWKVTQAGLWNVAVDGPLGETIQLSVAGEEGGRLGSASGQSTASLYDLALDAGDYELRVPENGESPRPYVLRAAPATGPGDPEPNDDTASAVPISDGVPVRGRLAQHNDRDRFVLTVAEGEPMLRDARLISRSDRERTLCLLDDDDGRRVCRRAEGGVALPGLYLPPGRHTLEVSGTTDPSEVYLLRVDPVGPATAEFETEPNESVENASRLDPTLGLTARGGAEDEDLFLLRTTGDPQLWRVDLVGSGIRRAELVRADGRLLVGADITADGAAAVFRDLYLVPGDHWLRVSATGLEYRLDATPLGPPDPDGEREPNETELSAERYRIGTRRIGRLPTVSDRDVYRFTLAAPQRIRLDLAQADDAATTLTVSTGGEVVHRLSGLPAGEPISADLWLGPGDHFIELVPERPVEADYELTSERLDPFSLAVDQEPNGSRSLAGPVPPSLSWSGQAADPDDEDRYVIPPLETPGELTIAITGEDTRVTLAMPAERPGATTPLRLTPNEQGSLSAVDPPLGVPLYLSIFGAGDYDVRLAGAGLEPEAEPSPPPVTMSLAVAEDAVAAHWPDEQAVEATLTVTNEAATELSLALDATTSDHRWRVQVPSPRLQLAAGERAELPLAVVVAPDAWADEPVRVSVRGTADDGGFVATSVEVEATRDSPPASPRRGWDLPAQLLGGLNAAALGLGAEPGGTVDPERERHLFDGLTTDGGGFSVFAPDGDVGFPLELSVDLAGDASLPVVAVIINPQASDGNLDELPLDFELELSLDGQTWEPALQGQLSPLPRDQVFLLDQPTAASQARLRWTSTALDSLGYVSLGEWKVIVTPGTVISAEPVDIAAHELGGHVITMAPFVDDQDVPSPLLVDDTERVVLDLTDDPGFDVTIGFHHGRAAQLTELDWQDPVGSRPEERVEQLDVLVSTEGPLGPWQTIGSWELRREPDGSVAPFVFGAPTWVRYLRLDGSPPAGAERIELPARIRVIERPTGDDYRSILGEWGERSPQGPFEWQAAADGFAVDLDADAGDTIDAATSLVAGQTATDRAAFGTDEDWYRLDVPVEHDALELVLEGRPIIGVEAALFDEEGRERPLSVQRQPDGGLRLAAAVEPGSSYAVRVHQPPFSAVFAFDTSPSMDPYLDMVIAGMRSFLADVERGREFVTILPFEEPPLVDGWEGDPYLLQDAFANHVVEAQGSSGAEASLISASKLLAEQDGARAILLVTDAETSTFDRTPELWAWLTEVRPVVFSVHIGGTEQPLASRQRMQAWAASGGGHYTYPSTHGEMERAFDRMATWLRRPASYTLSYQTLDAQPARLLVEAPSAGDGSGSSLALAPGVAVEIVLDTSGSMRAKVGGKRRIEIAKTSLRTLLRETLAEGTPVALRAFGGRGSGKKAQCSSELVVKLGPLRPARALKAVKGLVAEKNTSTPIAAALRAAAMDLADVEGLRSVVLVTDGKEKCGGDPPAAIEELRAGGVDIRLDIVGFALEDESVKAEMAEWAELGGGSYHDAANAGQLRRAMTVALSAPFRVVDETGRTVAGGTVGGEAVELPRGIYQVEVLVEPPVVFERIELEHGVTRSLTLPSADDG